MSVARVDRYHVGSAGDSFGKGLVDIEAISELALDSLTPARNGPRCTEGAGKISSARQAHRVAQEKHGDWIGGVLESCSVAKLAVTVGAPTSHTPVSAPSARKLPASDDAPRSNSPIHPGYRSRSKT